MSDGVPGGSPAYVARAPAKVILFGEHAINRGQPALAASVGLYATCRLRPRAEPGIAWRSDAPGHGSHLAAVDGVRALGQRVDAYRASEDYEAIRRLAAGDFFAPAKYILATAFGQAGKDLPAGLEIEFSSEIPQSCGRARAARPTPHWRRRSAPGSASPATAS
jgi:mevalonate kinase